GTHWLWEVVSMTVKGISDYEPRSKESTMLDFHVPEDFDNIARPRVLNTHLPFNLLPKKILEKRCKILYLQRNPKDMMVSGFNHLKKMVPPNAPPLLWEDWLHYLFTGQIMGVGWHKHKKGYEDILEERSDHVLPLFYEDMKKVCYVTCSPSQLRGLLKKGPKHRIPSKIDFVKCREVLTEALDNYTKRWCKSEGVEPHALND
ncbi:hypothetical protein FSP39_001523, partial [Pinctada imbricata]